MDIYCKCTPIGYDITVCILDLIGFGCISSGVLLKLEDMNHSGINN